MVDLTGATDARGQPLSPFKWPVAMTRGAYAETVEAGGHYEPDLENPGAEILHLPSGQDVPGRLWDVFQMLLYAIRREPASCDTIHFSVRVSGRRVPLWSRCGPGDDAEPVLTIMLKGED